MTITCDRTLLYNALTAAIRAVSSRATVDILKGILFVCDGATLTVTGNDLDLGIAAALPAEADEPGEIVLDAKLILDIVKKLPGDSVTFTISERGTVSVQSGLTEFFLSALPAAEYPALPKVEEMQHLELSQATLKRMLTQTIFAVSESKGVHTGVLFDVETDSLTLVALDGHRLALRRETVANEETYRFVIPGKTLQEVVKLLSDSETDRANIQVGERHALIRLGASTIITRLLEGEFLQYKSSIPRNGAIRTTVDTKALLKGVERVVLMLSERDKTAVKLHLSSDRLRLSCQTPLGSAQDDLPAEGAGELVIGFNHRYLLDALRRVDSRRVRLETNEPVSPCVLSPEEDEDAVFLVLPVRLQEAR